MLDPAASIAASHLRPITHACRKDTKIRRLNAQRDQVMAEAERAHHGEVHVQRQMTPRVVVQIGRATFESAKAQNRCKLVYDPKEGKIVSQRLA